MDPQRPVGPFDVRIQDAVITEIGTSLVPQGETVIDASGCAVIPGLVHSHIHLCQVLFRNAAEDRTLLPWLRERIWPLEAAHDAVSLRASADLGIAELLLSGATAALDMGTVRHQDQVFESARDLGFRLISGKSMMDEGADVPEGLKETCSGSLAESDRLRSVWDGASDGRLRYAYAPRFVLSCSDKLLTEVGHRVEAGARLHTHVAENVGETDQVRLRFSRGNVEALREFGLLSPRSTIAHAIHVSPEEIELLARTGTAVAHCPSANLKLASGVADVPALLRAGVTVGLGADGAPCNNNLDLWREMKLAGLLPRLKYGPGAIPAAKILEMATLGGARALGLAQEIGSLEPGKRADIAIVDLLRPHIQPAGEDIVTALVYAAQAADVRTVMVDGRIVVQGHTLQVADAKVLVANARQHASALERRAALSHEAASVN
jgi:cytosine/adenosine deaminase-related metal-dependent hydrolase